MAVQMLGIKTKFTDDQGRPLIGGSVHTYYAGTSLPQDTFSDPELTVPNTNPVKLDDTGSANIFLKGTYRVRVFDRKGKFVEEQDNVSQLVSKVEVDQISNELLKENEKTDSIAKSLEDAQADLAEIKNKQSNTINVKSFGITGDNSDITAQLMQIITDNPAYTKYYFPDGAYSFSGFLLEKDGIELIGQSKDGTIFNITQAPSGVSFRCGKRGANSDVRNDNLPVYNGVNPVFTLDDYSPATPEYPRYKDIRVDNVTLNFIGNHATGFDFYRIDGGGYDVKCTFNGTPTMGNVIRTFFCTNLWIPEIDTGDNISATFNTFFYWSYGIKGRRWNVGKGGNTSLEMKHAVNVDVTDVTVDGDTFSYSIGYGSNGINIDTLNSLGGTVRVKSSEEFDFSKSVTVGKLKINNPTGTGLSLSNVEGLVVSEYDINAQQPIYISYSEFYTLSSDTPLTPVKNTVKFNYTGNYDTLEITGGMTKYLEGRTTPALLNSSFGKGVLRGAAGNHILISGVGGVGDLFGTDGKVIHNKVIANRGFEESKRVYNNFEDDFAKVVKNVDFGDMEIQVTAPTASAKPIVTVYPLDNCTGRFHFKNALQQYAEIYLMFNSTFGLFADKTVNNNLYPITIHCMVNSEIYGIIKPIGRAILFDSSGTLYADGVINSKISMSFIYPTTPMSAPPIYTSLGTASKWKGLLDVSRSSFYAEDGASIQGVVSSVVTHIGETPTGYDKVGGGAYHNGALVDKSTPTSRIFTATTGIAPTIKPNYIGELAKNSALDEWYRAKNLTEWSAL